MDGSESWCLNGQRHRENGPSIISDHYKLWYQYGQLHRLDGPAKIYPDLPGEWYLYDKHVTEEEVVKFKKEQILEAEEEEIRSYNWQILSNRTTIYCLLL